MDEHVVYRLILYDCIQFHNLINLVGLELVQ